MVSFISEQRALSFCCCSWNCLLFFRRICTASLRFSLSRISIFASSCSNLSYIFWCKSQRMKVGKVRNCRYLLNDLCKMRVFLGNGTAL